MENLLSVRENVLSIAKVTKSGEYCIKKRESVISSKIVINYNILIWFERSKFIMKWNEGTIILYVLSYDDTKRRHLTQLKVEEGLD